MIQISARAISKVLVNWQGEVNQTLTKVAMPDKQTQGKLTHARAHETQLCISAGLCWLCCVVSESRAQRHAALRWHRRLLYQHLITYVALIRSQRLRQAPASGGWSPQRSGTGGWWGGRRRVGSFLTGTTALACPRLRRQMETRARCN